MSEQTTGIGRDQPSSEQGFVLLTVLFLMVLLSSGALFFVNAGNDELMVGEALHEWVRTGYASDAGIQNVVSQFRPLRYDTLVGEPGDEADLGWTTLENGALYRAELQRTDEGRLERMFTVRITADGGLGHEGRALKYVDLQLTLWGLDIDAAIKGGGGDFLASDGGSASGINTNPPGWDPYCEMRDDKPGLQWYDGDSIAVLDTASVVGVPNIEVDSTMTPGNVFDWGDFDYDDIVALATYEVPSASAMAGQIKPHTTGGGAECWVTPWKNWGDYEDPDGVCGDHFPIIHRTGDLTIQNGSGGGQGILIIDGDLTIDTDFEFYGIIIVKGDIHISADVQIFGAMISGGDVHLTDDAPKVQYSSCAVERSLLGSGLFEVRPLGTRAIRSAL